MWHKLEDKWDTLYCADRRTWSSSDYIVWTAITTDCNLGCKYCHEHKLANACWLDVEQLELISAKIESLENKAHIKLHITPTLGDILLSPFLVNILEWARTNNHTINLCSYFPTILDLSRTAKLINEYNENVCLCCSLHAYTEEQRKAQFNNPRAIAELLPLLNQANRYLNTVYIFSTIKPVGAVLNLLNPENVMVTLLSLIDYDNNRVITGNFPTQYKRLKRFIPNPEVLELINGRSFEYVCTN